jgi:hypothetical protein
MVQDVIAIGAQFYAALCLRQVGVGGGRMVGWNRVRMVGGDVY